MAELDGVPRVAAARSTGLVSRPSGRDPEVQYVMRERGVPLETAIQMIYVQGYASAVADASRDILGDRFAEVRIAPEGQILITVIGLTSADEQAVHAVGARLGIDGWLRCRAAPSTALADWERVRHELIRLQTEQPGVLAGYPTPDPGYREPPFAISLAAYAADVAAELHEQFGQCVELRVGALAYPSRRAGRRMTSGLIAGDLVELDPTAYRVQLDGPLTIASGHTARHGLILTNRTDQPAVVPTNGQLTAQIVDPGSGTVAGGFAGGQKLPGIAFTAQPGGTVRIPLLVGTASFDPDLGYALPPGLWELSVPFGIISHQAMYTPRFPFTITN